MLDEAFVNFLFLKCYFSVTVYIHYCFTLVSGVQCNSQTIILDKVSPDVSSLAPY